MTSRPIPLVVLAHTFGGLTAIGAVVFLFAELRAGNPLVYGLPFLLLVGVALAVGWLLAVRLPRHPIGWILIAIPALFVLAAPLQAVADASRQSVPQLSLWIDWYRGTDANPSWAWIPPVWLLLSTLPLFFPTGHLPSPRWRWFCGFAVFALLAASFFLGVSQKTIGDHSTPSPAYLPAVAHLSFLLPVVFALLGISFVGSIASLFVRYRRADVAERAQLRWMLWSVAVAVLALVGSWFLPSGFDFVDNWVLVAYGLIPVAVAVAVLRYRLYEIDRIISRTAAYLIVTLVVIGTYAVVVLVISLLLPKLPSVGVALATLAAAAVFFPVLRWVRRVIDRVFNRSQYNAERVVNSFGERIRTGADPHTAGPDLVSAISETLQPDAIGLWTPGGRPMSTTWSARGAVDQVLPSSTDTWTRP